MVFTLVISNEVTFMQTIKSSRVVMFAFVELLILLN